MEGKSAARPKEKALSSPFLTGGGGHRFESHVQSVFVALMAAEGHAPCLPAWPITEIRLQARHIEYHTDDVIVFATDPSTKKEAKLLVQSKHSLAVTRGNTEFAEVIAAAWQDFNNSELFNPECDRIALITGPLNRVDTDASRVVPEWARAVSDAKDFLGRFELRGFCDDDKREKLDVFRAQLDSAKGTAVTDDELWRFLKCFHLIGCDLDLGESLLSASLRALTGRYSSPQDTGIWEKIICYVQQTNQNAGVITRDSLSEEIRNAFAVQPPRTMPQELARNIPPQTLPNVGSHPRLMMFALLVGAWDERKAGDTEMIAQLADSVYSTWIQTIREVSQLPDSPLMLSNGHWEVVRREELWQELAARLYDDDVERFGAVALKVLSERDPALDLAPSERYAAQVRGKVWEYSERLRKGVATTLAILNSRRSLFTRCSANKIEDVVSRTIRALLEDADWERWASLESVLPELAEAAPEIFLNAVDHTLRQSLCPFDPLFAQEGGGLWTKSYVTGLLWALEGLAWDRDLLVRVVVLLGHLASKGGKSGNRPFESLAAILLPWFPQTLAPAQTRCNAIEALRRECPGVAWDLLLSLLPRTQQITWPTHKPAWRMDIPESPEHGVPRQEYWQQVDAYSAMAIDIAKQDTTRLTRLVEQIEYLPPSGRTALLEFLKSEAPNLPDEDTRTKIWNSLTHVTALHSRHPDAQWAMSKDAIEEIRQTAKVVAPLLLLNRITRLFSDERDNLDGQGSFNDQQDRLDRARCNSIQQLIREKGFASVVELARRADSPASVGATLACLDGAPHEADILPAMLLSAEQPLALLARGYVWRRFREHGWAWADGLDTASWAPDETGQFLAYLPFTPETWARASRLLDDNAAPYWTRTTAIGSGTKEDLTPAVERLLEVGRPREAVDCVWRMVEDGRDVDAGIAVASLEAVLSSSHRGTMDDYAICTIMGALQERDDVAPEVVARIEWLFLPLLKDRCNARPVALERRLAEDAAFLVDMIQKIYRGKRNASRTSEPSEERKRIAENAYRLLSQWKRPPGLQQDGSFDAAHFANWLDKVRCLSSESGHLNAALIHVGEVLIHFRLDQDGLWLPGCVSEALDAPENEMMREGFRTALLNSRGVYRHTGGEEERRLAEDYEQRARDLEKYPRLAAELLKLADFYRREAERPPHPD